MSKRIYRWIPTLLLLLVALSVLTTTEQSIVVEDVLGRHIELPGVPQRVVSMAPSITEVLAELGLLDRVVGVDSFSMSDWYLNTSGRLRERSVVDVGGYWWSAIKVEEILRLNPDVVLADSGAHKPLQETLESYNVTLVVYLTVVQLGASTRSSAIYTLLD